MNPEDPSPSEDFRDRLKDLAGMSDEELARLMDGGKDDSSTKGAAFDDLPAGERVNGTVLDLQGEEVLVEIDRKTLGVIDAAEYGDEPLPAPGSSINAEVIRFDQVKDVYILSVKGVHTEVAWDDLRPGLEVEGKVVEAVKGGLVLDLKGIRAFLPISQIELERVEGVESYVGQRLRCQVQEVDRGAKDLVLSRRAILERERAGQRKDTLASLREGEVRSGKVVRLTEHGAFVSLGAVDGLLHASKIHARFKGSREASPLKVGQVVEVQVIRVDAERGRVSLDFPSGGGREDSWEETSVNYKAGDEVTGWVSRVGPEGAVLSLGEGIEGLIPSEPGSDPSSDLRAGAIVKGKVVSIDRQGHRIVVKPREAGGA